MHVFLIDDDPDDQEIFLSIIMDVLPGSVCSVAANGYEALHKLSEASPPPDIIFLDLNMPLMNGKQFLAAIRNRQETIGRIPVVILSTSSNPNIIAEAKALGARHFITKPDRFSEWERIFRKFFAEQYSEIKQ